MKPTTITREQAKALTETTDFNPPAGFVRAPGGWISTHAAFERTLGDPDFPAKNAAAVAKERFDLEAGQRGGIARAEAELREQQRVQIEANRAHWTALQAKRDREQAAYEAGIAASGVNRV